MRQIVLSEVMHDSIANEDIGLIGTDLATHKKRFYIYYDENGKRTTFLHEINPLTLEQWSPNYRRVFASNIQRHIREECLPSLFEASLARTLDLHREFIAETNYNLPYFEKNAASLTTFWNSKLFSFNDAYYIPVENIITISSEPITRLNAFDIEEIDSALLHELEHMKGATFKINEIKNVLWIKCGLDEYEIPFRKIFLPNGDVFYLLDFVGQKVKPSAALDEIATEFVCEQINPYYHYSYPEFGGILNFLCDGNLLYIKYYQNADRIYEILQGIDPSYDLLNEFQNTLSESVFHGNDNKSKHARKLLKHYCERKKK